MLGKDGCANFVIFMAGWAVPVLIFMGYLCLQESPMIEMPNDRKHDAAWGCFGSAILYAVTFVGAYTYKVKAGNQETVGRQVVMQELQEVAERNRR
mmetsp:Transcript_13152/g.41308  ORF Transcript_13152/g.41308 Transcript_13152/m.41308 type:complete len:96 (+) Transcript_13152:98-385(+)